MTKIYEVAVAWPGNAVQTFDVTADWYETKGEWITFTDDDDEMVGIFSSKRVLSVSVKENLDVTVQEDYPD